jgi:hypothetical protein
VVAVMFAANPDDIPRLLEELLVADIPGCVAVGAVSCCHPAKGVFMLNTEAGWAPLGDDCVLFHPSSPDNGSYQQSVEFVELGPDLSEELSACCGIVFRLMTLAKPNGEPRVLVKTTSQSGDMSLPPSIIQRSALPKSPAIILARGHAPRDCTTTRPPSCCNTTHKRCHSNRRHWWVRQEVVAGPDLWCEQADGCSCC